jgi:hypothetical protein
VFVLLRTLSTPLRPYRWQVSVVGMALLIDSAFFHVWPLSVTYGSCWIPGSWVCRWCTIQSLSPFHPCSPSFSMVFNQEVRFSDNAGA